MSAPGIHFFKPAAVLRIEGEDAETFLQGQFSNDLRAKERILPVVYGLWLTAKGKVIGDSFVLKISATNFVLVSYFSPANVLISRIEAFIISDDVVVTDLTAEWAAVAFFASDEGNFPLVPLPLPGEYLNFAGGHVFHGRHSRKVNLDWLFPESARQRADKVVAQFRERTGAMLLDEPSVQRIRIEDSIPAVPTDIGPADLPDEGNLNEDAVSYEKGCYTGQEVMARLHSMGQVRRQLARVSGAISPPSVPAPLYSNGKVVGEIRSLTRVHADEFIGLALLNRSSIQPGAKFYLLGKTDQESPVTLNN